MEALIVFSSTSVKVMMNFPLEKRLKKLEKSGRRLNRVAEVGEFDLQFTLRTIMKRQALANFVTECSIPLMPEDQTILEDKDDNRLWTIYIDGSSNDHGSRAGAIMESLMDTQRSIPLGLGSKHLTLLPNTKRH